MQFGINKRNEIFQRFHKIARARRASAICGFEKFTSAYLFQIARDKSFDHLLIIYKWQFLSRFSILRDKWMVRLLFDKTLTCEFKRRIYSLSPNHVWKLSGFFIACEKQEPEQTAKENFPVALMRPSLTLLFEWLKNCAVFKFIFVRNFFNQHKLL